MSKKVREILLVSTLYDACIMEEDCRLAERIINEYRGLNLSHPPRLTWVSTAEEALAALDQKNFDLVVTMPRLADMDAFLLGQEVKKKRPGLHVILLAHNALPDEFYLESTKPKGIDSVFVWSGNTDLLLALIKSTEDLMNVARDTEVAGVRVILLIEDSPVYRSALLPILYREVVSQTQALMEHGLNEEHRLLTMRARPKIMVAVNYEEAQDLFERYKPFLLGVVSDVSFPHNRELAQEAGITFLTKIKREVPDLPLLLTSADSTNREKALQIPASFIDKNSPTLLTEVRTFFAEHLGFGDFVFRMPDGREIARVSNIRDLERTLPNIPTESFHYHWSRNDFSRWLFARCETMLANVMRPLTDMDFSGHVESMRDYLIANLHARRKWRQKGIVADFDAKAFDPDTDFFKIGKGSLGGKARGLAFVSTLLQKNLDLARKYPDLNVIVPQTLVITTEAFDAFIESNKLKDFAESDASDEEIARHFLNGEFPAGIANDIRAYLTHINYPLAVRSSGLLEDGQFRAYAGLYRTYMVPNCHESLDARVQEVITAIKLVYASTYYQGPKAFAKRVGLRTEEEKMAVILQALIGQHYGDSYYPAISGVAQSHNYYPFARMKAEEGIATIALGLGRMVVQGGQTLRFSPKYPQLLPQFSTPADILKNAQRNFYSLRLGDACTLLGLDEDSTLELRDVRSADGEFPVQNLSSIYIPAEQRFSDAADAQGHRILTFNSILKYNSFPLADILSDVLAMSQNGMGCPVEIEFSVNLCERKDCKPEFAFLQLRPMTARADLDDVDISEEDMARAFCVSTNALGNAVKSNIADIVYVKPETFDPAKTLEIAREISQLNADLFRDGRPYLLVGPGRWGSADRWLGIPVKWADIHGVAAVVETASSEMRAEPSQGSHFFHNVTTLGINYFTVTNGKSDFFDWKWLSSLSATRQTKHVAHVRLDEPFLLKVDGRKSLGVIFTVR